MKLKPLGFLFLLLLFSLQAHSQVSLGAYGGMVNSKFIGDPPPKGIYDWGTGWTAGLRLEVPVSSAIQLSTQPAYVHQKMKYSVPDWNGDKLDSLDLVIKSLSLPIGLMVISENEKFYAYSGFDFGYMFSGIAENPSKRIDFTDDMQNFNIAVQFAAGLRIPINTIHLFFEARYSMFILNTSRSNPDFENMDRVKIQGVRLVCGVQVPLSKKNQEDE